LLVISIDSYYDAWIHEYQILVFICLTFRSEASFKLQYEYFAEFYVLLAVHLDVIVKKNQLDAQLILSIFCQTLHVLGISRPIIRR